MGLRRKGLRFAIAASDPVRRAMGCPLRPACGTWLANFREGLCLRLEDRSEVSRSPCLITVTLHVLPLIGISAGTESNRAAQPLMCACIPTHPPGFKIQSIKERTVVASSASSTRLWLLRLPSSMFCNAKIVFPYVSAQAARLVSGSCFRPVWRIVVRRLRAAASTTSLCPTRVGMKGRNPTFILVWLRTWDNSMARNASGEGGTGGTSEQAFARSR